MVFIKNGDKSDSTRKTCTVKVSSVDSTCAYLWDKILVGSGLTKNLSTGVAGLAITLDVDYDGVTSGVESEEMNHDIIMCENVDQDNDDNWVLGDFMWSDTVVHGAGLYKVKYENTGTPAVPDWDLNVLVSTSKILDENLDVTKNMQLSHGIILQSDESDGVFTPFEAVLSIDMLYITTGNYMGSERVVDEFHIFSTDDAVLQLEDFEITRPTGMQMHTPLIFYATISEAGTLTEPNERASEILMTSGTLYTRVTNYPIKELQL